jgi:hypothetical protein
MTGSISAIRIDCRVWHAYGFVHHRLMINIAALIVPVMLNTYFRLNPADPGAVLRPRAGFGEGDEGMA